MTEIFKKVFNPFKPGGKEHSASGATIIVSSNGTTSVDASDVLNVIQRRFDEMSGSSAHSASPAKAAHD